MSTSAVVRGTEKAGTATAYLRCRADEPVAGNRSSWRLSKDAEEILETPADELVFIPSVEPPLPHASDAVGQEFQLRFPASDAALTRIHIQSCRYDMPRDVTVYNDVEWYDGADSAEVAQLAQRMGKVEVSRGNLWEGTKWLSARGEYGPRAKELHELGCYLRHMDVESVEERSATYVVYNPKVAARRLKRDQAREDPSTNAQYHQYVHVHIFTSVGRDMADECQKVFPPYLAGYEYRYTNKRHGAMIFLLRSMGAMELIFGPRSYWQVESFRTLMAQWKVLHQKTWDEFNRTAHDSKHKLVFPVLDDELARRKPRKWNKPLKDCLPKGVNRWRGR